jgi:hypothetical protein
MTSHYYWNRDIVKYINDTIPHGSMGLDVGAGAGKFYDMMGGEYPFDAIEIFKDYIELYQLEKKYKKVYNVDVCEFKPEKRYRFGIMGDCLEHLSTSDAKKVVHVLGSCCDECFFVIPYEYPQDTMNGNTWEIHLQPDLTPFNVKLRYPSLYPLFIKYDGRGTFDLDGIGLGVYTTKPTSKETVTTRFSNPILERLFLDMYFNTENL